VFKTVRALGLQVPGDVSLIAFHDADWTSVTTPAVTVIAQPIYDLGRESARMLIERVHGAVHAPRRFVLKSTLIDRESVGAPAMHEDSVKLSKPARARMRTGNRS
jgi:LacI family transcriptional regulator